MKNRLLKILLTMFLICMLLVPITACMSGNIAPIEITEKLYRQYVYLNKEYDVMDIVENKDDTLKYEITDLYYLDSGLEKFELEYTGTKFTQSEPFDVYVTLQASRGKKSVEAEFVVEFAIEADQTSSNFVKSWAEEGVTRIIVANKDYLYNDSTFAIKLSYVGNIQKATDGVALGSINAATDDMSMTSWDNVVLTADVYNPQDYDIELGLLFVQSNNSWTNDGAFENKFYMFPKTLKAKEFTTIAWSLKALGIQRDIFEEGVSIRFKCRITNEYASKLSPPYSYSCYVNNLDITDYSETRFPGMDTELPIKKNGVSKSFLESYSATYVSRDTTKEAEYQYNTSEYAIKIGINGSTWPSDISGIVSSAAKCSLTNWDNAVLTADVYNEYDRDIEMGILFVKNNNSWNNDGKIENMSIHKPITLKAGEWTTVAWSMKSFGVKSDVFAEEKVSIQIKTQIKDKSGLTSPYSYSFAIANFDLVDYTQEKFPMLDTTEPAEPVEKNGANTAFLSSWKPSYVSRVSTTESKYLHNGSEYAIKLDLTNTTQKRDVLGSIKSSENCSLTSWDNVVLTADIYNEYDSDLEIGILFVDTTSDSSWYNDGNIPTEVILNPITLTKQNWTTVAWSLRSFGITSNIFDENISIRLLARIKGKTDFSVAASYSVAITNLDIVDYSAEKFPELNTYYGKLKTNGKATSLDFTNDGNIETISFDYCLLEEDGVVSISLRKGLDSTNKYGIFKFNATGAVENYAGITVISLGTGYNRVIINLDEVTLKAGDESLVPSLTEVNKVAFEQWARGDCYISNSVKTTYKQA